MAPPPPHSLTFEVLQELAGVARDRRQSDTGVHPAVAAMARAAIRPKT